MSQLVNIKSYQCHKSVYAFEIGKIEGLKIYEKGNDEAFIEVSPEYISKNPLNQPGYFVLYEDGYRSFSPKAVFEAGYHPSTNMTFGDAVEALKGSLKVARAGWNGKGMWLGYVDGSQWGLGSDAPYDYGQAGSKLLPWIGMKTADGCFVPWLASQTDILAEDWTIVD